MPRDPEVYIMFGGLAVSFGFLIWYLRKMFKK